MITMMITMRMHSQFLDPWFYLLCCSVSNKSCLLHHFFLKVARLYPFGSTSYFQRSASDTMQSNYDVGGIDIESDLVND